MSKILGPLTPEQLARAEACLLNPAPGSRIEAARNYGIDLTLLVEHLRLTPAERASKLESASKALEQVRGIARRHSYDALGPDARASTSPDNPASLA
jgi:hypothetical protein